MITVVERKSYTAMQVGAGTDQVVAAMPIPPGGVLLGSRVEIHAISTIHFPLATSAASIFAKTVVAPMGGNAMDTGISLQTLWDSQVPKDSDLSVVAGEDDIDWDDGAIAGPFEEPGQINWNDLVQLGQRPANISEREVMMTFANGGLGFPHVDTTDEAFFRATMRMGSNKKLRTPQAAYWMCGVAAPSWDETTTTQPTTIANANWSVLTYPDVLFDMMLPDILGLTETGGESPFSDAAQFALDLVEPVVFEEAAVQYRAVAYNLFVKWSVRIATPGRPQMKTLTGGMAG